MAESSQGANRKWILTYDGSSAARISIGMGLNPGRALFFSENSARFFDYAPGELRANEPVTKLLPPPIRQFHDRLMAEFQYSTASQHLSNFSSIFYLSQKGYLQQA